MKFETALRALAEGNSLRATARIVEADKDRVVAWLDRGARQCRAVMLYLWRDLPVRECQLDELWSFIHTKQENSVVSLNFRDELQANWGTIFPERVVFASQEARSGTTRSHGSSKHDR